MSSLNTGSLANTFTVPAVSYTPQLQQVVTNAAGSLAYVVEKNTNGRVYKMLLSSPWTITQLNTDGSLTAPYGVALSSDETTLYILCDTGTLFSMPISTGVPTQIGTFNNIDTFTTQWRVLFLDPGNPNQLFVLNISGKKVYSFNLIAATTGVWMQWFATFVGAFGIQQNKTDRVFVALAPSGQGAQNLLFIQYKSDGVTKHFMHEILLGDYQTNSNVNNATAQASTLAGAHSIAGDDAGRVYVLNSAPKIRAVVSNVVTDVVTPASGSGGPTAGMCWAPNGTSTSGGYLCVTNSSTSMNIYQ